jgi:hypothetical protein
MGVNNTNIFSSNMEVNNINICSPLNCTVFADWKIYKITINTSLAVAIWHRPSKI